MLGFESNWQTADLWGLQVETKYSLVVSHSFNLTMFVRTVPITYNHIGNFLRCRFTNQYYNNAKQKRLPQFKINDLQSFTNDSRI